MKRFAVLDAFRGLFAMAIVFFHMKNYNWVTDNAFVNNSDLFVSFFFVLSGFVIAFVYYDKISSKATLLKFFGNRFRRIYPLHLYALLVFAAFELSKSYLHKLGYFSEVAHSNNTLPTFLSNLFLLNATPIGGGSGLSWNYPSWSISAEFITYLFFGWLVFFLRKTAQVKSLAMIIIPFALIGISYSVNSLVFEAIVGFFLGALVYKIYCKYPFLKNINVASGTVLEAGIFSLTLMMVCNKPVFNDHLYVYPFLFATNIYLFAFEKGIISAFLKKNIFQTLGRYSYSIYLNHAIVIEVVNFILIRFCKLQGTALYIMPFVIAAITIAYSALTYHCIELRFYKKHSP